MSLLSMLAQAFAMIPRKHDQGVVIKSFCLQESNQAPKLRVRECNLTVV